MSNVQLSHIAKRFGDHEVIRDLDLDVAPGEFCVFVGPSGCGKSTLLRMIAGLEKISDGTLSIGGRDMTHVPPANRGIAMVFQSYALYPHMTVSENISFGLRMGDMPKAEIERRVSSVADTLGLTPLLHRRPSQLSGGQRQRVAIGRAMVREPVVFLFDEPLSNLDAALRLQTRVEILRLHRQLGATMIYVTHDQVEAMTMADKIVVLSAGRIEQVGTPLELYHRPDNLFVAGFLGSPRMNFLQATLVPDNGHVVARLAGGSLALASPGTLPGTLPGTPPDALHGEATLGIRPEHLRLLRAGEEGAGLVLSATVDLAEHLGAETILHLTASDGTPLLLRTEGLAREGMGDAVQVLVVPEACHLFAPDGRTLLNGSQG